MSDFEKVEALMDGREMGPWAESHGKAMRGRSLTIPVSLRSAWVAFHPVTLDVQPLHYTEDLNLRIMDLDIRLVDGGVSLGRRLDISFPSLITTTGKTSLPDKGRGLTEGYDVKLLGEAIDTPFGAVNDRNTLNGVFRFSDEGAVLNQDLLRTTTRQFEELMGHITGLREMAGITA